MMMAEPDDTVSKVEVAKGNGDSLRGTIAETLATDATHFVDSDTEVLKFHGIYQQDDRDQRRARRAQGLEKAYQFMIRCAIPGGVMTSDQYLALDAMAEQHGQGALRVTSRQGLQFHGVIKANLKKTMAGINETLVTTLSACGDVPRNVMACPAPVADDTHQLVSGLARRIAERLRPATGAYHEIWLDRTKTISTEPEEPFYGSVYLPRKFKIGVALDSHSCIDVYTHDCGLVAVTEGGRVRGFDLLVGGGLGLTHRKADTFARLAQPLGFIDVDDAVEAVRTVVAIFRDHGNRSDRRHARLKYLVADWGIDRFREEFCRRVQFPLASPVADNAPGFDDHLGRHPQGNGEWFYGIYLESGRIADNPARQPKSALRKVVVEHKPGVVLTPQQNVLLTDLPETALDRIEQTLLDHGIGLACSRGLKPAARVESSARRYSIACPALPTCGLAITESERIMPTVLDRMETELKALGLRDVPLTARMTGCPNGCARPYNADVAFVGSGKDAYNVYVGGGLRGDRMADLYAVNVSAEELVVAIRPLLQVWAQQRRSGESLGDFYQRLTQRDQPRMSITGKEEPTQDAVLQGFVTQ